MAAASQNMARLRDQTMGSLEDEEAVTVNTRALIDKVLARYSGEWTTLRELIQNAADAQAKTVTIRFDTQPSATVPLPPPTATVDERLRHTLLHHTLRTLLVANDGEVFQETDWQRLKRIAEGNPDETKIGAFGVGFYSVFADCESPFVTSGRQSMAFYWKKDSLFTRRGKLPEDQAGEKTTFLLDYRNSTTPVPSLLSLCQFLATSLTFVGLERIELFVDDWQILQLNKKMSPGENVKIPNDVNPRTRDGLMKITGVEYQMAQIDAKWMNVVGWNRRAQAAASNAVAAPANSDSGGVSLRSWFGRFTSSATNTTARKAQREEDALQQAILEDLAGYSTATVFLRMSTVSVQTSVSRSLAQELERATKKPPPKQTRIAILTSSYDASAATVSALSGSSSKRAADIFASVLPSKSGRIFIGFPTAQTTGLLAHISAPSVIPTVERESIDLNARYVRDWNVEMLRVAGIACRIAYTGEMVELRAQIERSMLKADRKRIAPEDITAVLPSAVHVYKQYNYAESTPSSKVGQYIEEAFWTCNQKATIDVLSTRGVLPSSQVRVATEQLSFVEGIPVIPSELMEKANEFLSKLRDYGLLSDITTGDIKRELEAQALTEQQVTELVKWACQKVHREEMDAGSVQTLFDGTVASISSEHVATAASPVLQLGQIQTFVNSSKVPVEMPTPAHTIPFRLTKSLSPAQLQSIGWEELQVVPWLRWVVDSNGSGFGPDLSLTSSPAVASQVLPVVSKAWDGLSASSRHTVQELLMPRTVIPTKLGMRLPAQSYFGNVKLFDDLPTITGLQGVKEKFLATLGVRKTVELTVVFDRLMAKSATPASEEGKWSHVDLIKYLVSVREDIPQEDLKRLRQTPICPAEAATGDQTSKGKLYRLSELFEPEDSIRKLGLPILQWPGLYRSNTPEGRFLRSLGLQVFPAVTDLVDILAKAPAGSELQQCTLNYWIANAYQNGYHKFPVGTIDKAFLPVQPFAGEGNNLIAKPSQCFANSMAAVLRFRTLRADLQPHAAIFGVAPEPPIVACAERLMKNPPANITSAQTLFGYFATRLPEIGPNDAITRRLGEAAIVPIVDGRPSEKSAKVRLVAPRACFLGDSATYGDIFDFVDFGPEANSFLLRVGSKHEPNASEIATMLTQQPTRLLDTLGAEKYLQLLRKIAEYATHLKKDRQLWQGLKLAPCLLAEKLVRTNVAVDEKSGDYDDDAIIKEYSLARASDMVLVDDFTTYRLFQAHLLSAPQEEVLEELYAALDTPSLSQLTDNHQRMGALLNDQSGAMKLHQLLVERCRLFLHDHTADVIRHDARWLDQNLSVKTTEFLQITRKLKGYRMSHTEKRTAALHRESKRDATLYVTAQYDLYEVSRAVMILLLKRPRQQDFLALETILGSDLRRLQTKGYNVDRILRQKAAESRIAESERQKRAEEQKRLAETSKAAVPSVPTPMALPAASGSSAEAPGTPDRTLSMPGSFGNDSPEQSTELVRRSKQPGGLFGNLTKHLGLENLHAQATKHLGLDNSSAQANNQLSQAVRSSNNAPPDLPPPYAVNNPNTGRALAPGTERVTSPSDIQANLQTAIKATREYNASSLFSPPTTRDIKETPLYCDHTHGQDLSLVTELPGGMRLYLPRSADPTDSGRFLQTHAAGLAHFTALLAEAATIFELAPATLNIFHDAQGATIAFNRNGSLFCNLRYFLQLHYDALTRAQSGQDDGAAAHTDALAYWFVTLCHELAHNLVGPHNAEHSYYTESFVAHYFRRLMWLAARGTGQGSTPGPAALMGPEMMGPGL